MRPVFYREVHLLSKGCHRDEGELILSFSAFSFEEVHNLQGMLLLLSSRERLANRVFLFSSYTASYFVEGQSTKLVLTRHEKDPLMFVKLSPKLDWVLIKDEVEKPISPAGNYSLTFNSEGMYRGFSRGGDRKILIYKD